MLCLHISENLRAVDTFPMSEHPAVFPYRTFDALHRVVAEHPYVDVLFFKNLQSLPYSFHASSRISLAIRYRDIAMWIEWA